MSYVFVFGIVVGGLAVWWVMRNRMSDSGFLGERHAQKEENKRRVLDLFDTKQRVTNDDVEELLSVSNATAERYLDELEKEGYIRQVGRTGRSVYYEKS